MCLSVVQRSLNYNSASGSAPHTALQKGTRVRRLLQLNPNSSQVFQIGWKLNVIAKYRLVEAAHFLLKCPQNVLDIVGPKVTGTRIGFEGFKAQI